ncbi:ribosomal L7Ae/L30e/S12e/Gadd45 family protein [Pediococcus pentosaceus]|uniref:L7Ae/L30e/S12e/Gadd45 family ribosomal protein n=1 Tax=Pediococcus pentosaceus TaxID=1255 RepID=UPI0018E10F96|nr:ribosomal L7Ae/L30e/S12e/Gadd45 family protein [Pediococcus pentosaceus]MBF7103895.1 ribosomal L7Ae/L30e/S12e/Gadd45 family protein [Pediococcus pentosaceus]QQC62124.1 ribosomal L7Ae/L30e/S12e/Gadd45 family protein [Pediococcus pentosaceus]
MIKENISKYLGLMRRSGNLVTGQELVLSSIRSQKAKFVLVTEDIGESSKKKIIDKCHFYEVPFTILETKEDLSKAIGQERSVVATENNGFAKGLLKKINE